MKAYHLMKKFDNKQRTQALQKENMGQPILSLIQIYVNGVNREKKIQLLMKIKKKNRAFCRNLYKILQRTK